MNRRMTLFAALSLAAALALGAAAAQVLSTGQTMTGAARAFAASLDDEQRDLALMDFDDPERLDWHFVPKGHRKGLQLGQMNDAQRERADRLLRAAMSEAGYDKTTQVMLLEVILHELQQGRGAIRDPDRYYFTLFGQPDADSRWGLSVEGHHLSLNFVVDGGEVKSHTPLFFGTNPAIVLDEVEGGLPEGTQILDDEERLAFALLHALDDDRRAEAVIDESPPRDVRGGGQPQAPDTPPAGLAGERMNDEQRGILRELVDVYLANMPADVAQARRHEVEEAGYEAVHFAWAGADEPGVGHYYRLQGPTFLVELANTQPDTRGRPANHVHAMWRDVRGDFGIPR